MTSTADLPVVIPADLVLPIRRKVDGVMVDSEIAVCLWPDGELAVDEDWNGNTWRKRRMYRVAEARCDFAGRGFQVAKADGDIYGVFLADDPRFSECSCRGFQAHGYCVHHDAVAGLVAADKL